MTLASAQVRQDPWPQQELLRCGAGILLPDLWGFSTAVLFASVPIPPHTAPAVLSRCVHTCTWARSRPTEVRTQSWFPTSWICLIFHWCTHVNTLQLFICSVWERYSVCCYFTLKWEAIETKLISWHFWKSNEDVRSSVGWLGPGYLNLTALKSKGIETFRFQVM